MDLIFSLFLCLKVILAQFLDRTSHNGTPITILNPGEFTASKNLITDLFIFKLVHNGEFLDQNCLTLFQPSNNRLGNSVYVRFENLDRLPPTGSVMNLVLTPAFNIPIQPKALIFSVHSNNYADVCFGGSNVDFEYVLNIKITPDLQKLVLLISFNGFVNEMATEASINEKSQAVSFYSDVFSSPLRSVILPSQISVKSYKTISNFKLSVEKMFRLLKLNSEGAAVYPYDIEKIRWMLEMDIIRKCMTVPVKGVWRNSQKKQELVEYSQFVSNSICILNYLDCCDSESKSKISKLVEEDSNVLYSAAVRRIDCLKLYQDRIVNICNTFFDSWGLLSSPIKTLLENNHLI